MSPRTHSRNKYSKSVSQSAVVNLVHRAPTDFQIRLEISPDHTALLDFAFLAERPQIQKAFFEGFTLLGDSVAAITKVTTFYAIKNFSMFLDEYEEKNGLACHETYDIDTNLLLNFKIWLETRPQIRKPGSLKTQEESMPDGNDGDSLSANTIYLTFSKLNNFLKKTKNYHPEWFPYLPAELPRWSKPSGDWKPANDVLGVEDLKRILAAAKSVTDKIRSEHEKIQQVLKQSETLPVVSLDLTRPIGYWRKEENLVHSLIRENGIAHPIADKICRALALHYEMSPISLLRMYVPTGEASLLPFALQLYILTGLNVTSLLTLTRDCVEDFPLPQYKKISYDKPRSGTGRAKSQLFPAHATNSKAGGKENPIEIIEFLTKWTEPLIEHAEERLQNYLFLFRAVTGTIRSKRVRLVSKFAAFEESLREFIDSHRESYQLPNFTLRDLRPAVATYLYFQTRDIFRVQRFLGHENIKTTIAYIRGRVIAAEHDKSMANAIEQMIRRIIPNRTIANSTDKEARSLPILATVIEGNSQEGMDQAIKNGSLQPSDVDLLKESGAMTLVARCRQPNKPPAFLNVPPGQICTMIFKCLTCPNAVILEEDLPTLLIKISQIWDDRERFSEEGWLVLYADAWLTLNQAVRLFSKEAVERATKQAAAMSRFLSPGA